MENFKLEAEERKKMLEFTAKVDGSVDEKCSDREVLLNYNKALAQFVLWADRKILE